MSSQDHSSSPGPSSRQTTPERLALEDPSRSKCSCGKGDGTGDYIYCDNDACKVGWYHWECVQVTKIPAGTWLCPSCSPSAAFYIKQLVQTPAAPSPSPVPKVEMTGDPAALSAAPRPKTTAERAVTKAKEQQPETDRKMKEVKNVGVAMKKPAAKKPKGKWIGWIEMTSDDEEEFKKTVDAQWSVEDTVLGKRTRASKAVNEGHETGTRTLRRNSWRKIVETTSDEEEGKPVYQDQQEEATDSEGSLYQEEDKEKEEVRFQKRGSVIEIQSDDSNDSEDIMEVTRKVQYADKGKARELSSDSATSGEEERQISPDLVRTDSTVNQNGKRKVSEVEIEGPEDIMDESLDADSSDSSDGSQYVDDQDSSASTEILATASGSREVRGEPTARLEDAMELDIEDEGHEGGVSLIPTPVVDFATLYKRQGNHWGEFPESAIRSTLPRLG